MKKIFNRNTLFLFIVGLCQILTSCSKETSEITDSNNGDNNNNSKYIIAGTSSSATYLLTLDNINSGEASIIGNGLEVDNASYWAFYNNKYAYRLVYNQGNAGITTSYFLDSNGNLKGRNISHEIQNRFTTYGIYKNYILTAAAGATSVKDNNNNEAYGVLFTKIDAEEQILTTETVVSENLLGTGEYCTLSGFLQRDNKLFSAVCPIGVSVYGVNNFSDLLSPQAKALINSEGGISGSINPNRVYIAIYKDMDFNNPKIISDDRISYATSRYRSQYYQTIENDDNGNIYVFSSSYATTLAGIQKTNLPSGVIKINANEEDFDKDYYVNFEDDAVAGSAMYKVWHITGEYFLMQMYAEKGDDKSYTANTNRLGVFKSSTKEFKWINGVPSYEDISSISRNVYTENGKAYIVITENTQGAKPTIYQIDPILANAVKGVIVTADGVSAIGKLNIQ